MSDIEKEPEKEVPIENENLVRIRRKHIEMKAYFPMLEEKQAIYVYKEKKSAAKDVEVVVFDSDGNMYTMTRDMFDRDYEVIL